jgi:hypothetical protein
MVSDRLLPDLVPISGLMDGDGAEWDQRDPMDLLPREERERILAWCKEYDRCMARALVEAHHAILY